MDLYWRSIKKMKIGYLVYNLDGGAGWGRYARDLIEEVKKYHEVVVVKELPDKFDDGPVLLKTGWKTFFVNWIRLFKIFRDCDIIHAIDLLPYGFVGFVIAKFMGKKFVVSGIGTYSVAPLYNKYIGWYAKLIYLLADCVVSISKYTDRQICKIVKPKRHEVVIPGIDLSKFELKSVNHAKNKRYMLTVGALKRRKGQDISLQAFAIARKSIPDLEYIIVGSQRDVNYFNYLKEIVAKNNLNDCVYFKQGISDDELTDLYANAQLFIMLSRNEGLHYEGFGLVFLEAAALGLPVIGTRNNGIEDAVNPNQNGFLVDQENMDQPAEAIIKICSDEKLRQEMSEKSLTWARNHDTKTQNYEYIKIYESLIKTV